MATESGDAGAGLTNEILRAALGASPDGVLIIDAAGIVRYASAAADALFGARPGALIGTGVDELVPARLRERHAAQRADYITDPRARRMGIGLDLAGRRRDGSEVALEISLAPLPEPGLTAAIVRDVTEQRRRDEARTGLRRSVEEIVAGLDALVWESATPDRHVLSFVGGRDASLFGYPRAEWTRIGFWLDAVHPEDRAAATTLGDGDAFTLSYRLLAADGSVREVTDAVTVQRGAGGRILSLRGVITDVTDRRRMAERLSQTQKMEAVGQLAGGIAHDFNNLLTIVSGYARRLSDRPALAAHARDLEQILTASDRAAQLTRELLAFARRGESRAERLDVAAVLGGLEPMLRRLLAADISLRLELAAELPPVIIDRTALEQVAMNLIINAADAMPSGGRLTVRAEDDPGDGGTPASVRISVIDTGVGMDEAVAARIFEPFFTTKGERGNGMGLATVYGTVEQAGGSMEVNSAPGAGTTITVRLPAVSESPPADREPEGLPLVLLVEDEPALRKLVALMLEERGYSVLAAGDGIEALALAERHPGPIALLVTDVVMPEVSGPELVRRLQDVRPGIAVLYMSGYNDSRLLSRGVDETAVNLLVKPFTPDQLIARVAELLDPGRA